jgi:hypothetical protein
MSMALGEGAVLRGNQQWQLNYPIRHWDQKVVPLAWAPNSDVQVLQALCLKLKTAMKQSKLVRLQCHCRCRTHS